MGELTLDNFCRLCLKETFTLSDIYTQCSASGEPVYKTLNFLYDLEISQDDGLPTQICAPCLWRMIEFEAYKKNVHCAKEEILKQFGKVRKVKDEVFDGDSNDGCGMEDQDPPDHRVEELEEELPEPCSGMEKIPAPYGQAYADQHMASDWSVQQQIHQDPTSQLTQRNTSRKQRQRKSAPPVVHPPPTPQVYPEVPKVTPEWLNIPKDISVSPIPSTEQCHSVPQQPRIPEGYLSQSGVHFLAGALLTNKKVIHKEIPAKVEIEPVHEKTKLRSERVNNFEVFVKQEVQDVEDENNEELHSQQMMDYLSKPESLHPPSEEVPMSLCAEDLRSKMLPTEDEYWNVANTSKSETVLEGPILEGKEAYVCDVCKKSYSEKIHLGEHMKYHYQNRHYFCRVCGDRFQQSRARGRHELLHLKEEVFQKKKDKPHTCGTCGKQFGSKSSFYRHCNEHTDKYACPTCGKSFSCSKDLKRHTIIHSNEKPFQCEVCQRSFNQKGNLNKHMVTHSMERPFDCTMCDRKFKTKRERNNHELTHLRRQVFPKSSPIQCIPRS